MRYLSSAPSSFPPAALGTDPLPSLCPCARCRWRTAPARQAGTTWRRRHASPSQLARCCRTRQGACDPCARNRRSRRATAAAAIGRAAANRPPITRYLQSCDLVTHIQSRTKPPPPISLPAAAKPPPPISLPVAAKPPLRPPRKPHAVRSRWVSFLPLAISPPCRGLWFDLDASWCGLWLGLGVGRDGEPVPVRLRERSVGGGAASGGGAHGAAGAGARDQFRARRDQPSRLARAHCCPLRLVVVSITFYYAARLNRSDRYDTIPSPPTHNLASVSLKVRCFLVAVTCSFLWCVLSVLIDTYDMHTCAGAFSDVFCELKWMLGYAWRAVPSVCMSLCERVWIRHLFCQVTVQIWAFCRGFVEYN